METKAQPIKFNSVEEECRFWKERAKICQNDCINVKLEYDDFVQLSKQMENEMDASLDQKEYKLRELNSQLAYWENANSILKQKIATLNIELMNFRVKFEISEKEQESFKEHIRILEQKNDDLERFQRSLEESVNDLTDSLEKAYEKNAMLEIEIEEKEALEEKLQRLMDEMRDLKNEFNVQLDKVASSPLHRSGRRQQNWKVYGQKSIFQSVEARRNGNARISDVSRENVLEILGNMLKKLNTMQENLEAYRDA